MGYPGIVLDKNGDKVEGFLFSSDKISEHWSEFDEFEGNAYERDRRGQTGWVKSLTLMYGFYQELTSGVKIKDLPPIFLLPDDDRYIRIASRTKTDNSNLVDTLVSIIGYKK